MQAAFFDIGMSISPYSGRSYAIVSGTRGFLKPCENNVFVLEVQSEPVAHCKSRFNQVASRYANPVIREFYRRRFPVKTFNFNIAPEFIGQISDFVLKGTQGYARFLADFFRPFVFLNEKEQLLV
jgi:hypothetical protein